MTEVKKSGAARSQPETRNEDWSDERVKSFLRMQAPEGVPVDYHLLMKAYRGMLPETFARFVSFFVEEGHDINTPLDDGTTILDLVSRHRRAGDYIRALEAAGARKGGPAAAG